MVRNRTAPRACAAFAVLLWIASSCQTADPAGTADDTAGAVDSGPDPKRGGALDAGVTAPGRRDGGHADASDGARIDAEVTGPDTALDVALATIIDAHGLSGDPATPRGRARVRPADDALVRLGQVLFFSQTLSGGFDSACGTCHHPDLGGSDGLSISVGVVPSDRNAVGPGRTVDSARDLDPSADGGPNMHRNSLTVFNVALHDRGLLSDGRVFVLDEAVVPGGHEQLIRTPEDGNGATASDAFGLLEVMARFPLVNDNEMRAFMYTDLTTPASYRERLVQRLRGQADANHMTQDASSRWLALFRAGFGQPTGSADSLITLERVQRALAAYLASQIFVDTPWRRYVEGQTDAIEDEAKRGALLFFEAPDQGGLGCASCHAGDRFTDESFQNVGFPQIGRGFRRADKRDPARWGVTRRYGEWFGFRVPGLLNVALTAPYGHAGTFATLEQVLHYHADPRAAVDGFDFSLQHLSQFEGSGIVYEHAAPYTREAIAHESFAAAEPSLPRRSLTDDETRRLVAFLTALTDECASDHACREAWTPDASLDPDGHLLVRDRPDSPAPEVDAMRPTDYPAYIDLSFLPVASRSSFADVTACEDGMQSATNTGLAQFVNRTGSVSFGLTAPHGFSAQTWLVDQAPSDFEAVMMAGGASPAHLDDDCWPDIAFAGGDASGLVFYRNRGAQNGYDVLDGAIDEALRAALGTRFSGIAVADLDGDYRRELVLGNIASPRVPILSPSDAGSYYLAGALPMTRHTYGIAFGLLGPDDHPSLYLSHWGIMTGTSGSAPALFRSEGGLRLRPYDEPARTSSAYVDQGFNFTPSFADFRGSGLLDLVIASDFGTSQTLLNVAGTHFENATDRSVITDENGMGSALGDFDNDGQLDWFVTSVFDPSGMAAGNWGVTGNRLYRNVSSAAVLAFEDITAAAGVADGAWGWGACAADFDHDGFLDIFHANGFGYIPDGLLPPGEDERVMLYTEATQDLFQAKPSRLFVNQGDGTFQDRAADFGLDVASEGRGVTCFDYDRDGDVDILLVDHSTGLQFFENQTGHGPGRRFLHVRVVGTPPNTDALGARVTVIASVSETHGLQSQVRVGAANSNYNSQNLPDLHFGMASAASAAQVTVEWPNDPTPLVCSDVPTNRFVVFDQRDKVCP